MKNMKKILALLVAIMILAASMSALATGSISLNGVVTNLSAEDANKHEYKVYQIFTGTLKDGKLEDVKYGANFGDTGASVPKTELDAITDAAAYAKSLESADPAVLKGNPIATLTSANQFKAENLADGYYLIVDDTAKVLSDGDAYSTYMIQVAGTVTNLEVKKEVPESHKTITADDLGENGKTYEPGVRIDNVSIGDTVTYTLTAKVPTRAADFDKYFFILNDTLDAGLTFDVSTANITVKAGEDTLTKDTDYYVYTGDKAEGHTFQIAMANAKALAGKTITVTYKATLNENCNKYEVPNKNTYYVTYSNNPKIDYEGHDDEENPGKPDSTVKDATGETPEEETETYTTGIRVKKVDQDGKPLAGAKFKIEGKSINQFVTNTETFAKAADGEYWKLKNGSYTKDAPATSDTMIAAPAGATDGYVEDENGDVEVGGKKYRVVDEGETPTHILQKGNAALYDSTTDKYKKTTTTSVKTTTEFKSEELAVNADGTLDFVGLGAGEYTITETEAPQGYTKAAEAIKVTISFNDKAAEGTAKWSATGNTGKDDDGCFFVTLENKAGSTLPATGGIGTTIFYVAGSILVLAAVILLVTKRRMGGSDD